MARRKKRRDAKWRYARRLLLVGSWVLLLVVILGAVLRWGVTGARRSLEIERGARREFVTLVAQLSEKKFNEVLHSSLIFYIFVRKCTYINKTEGHVYSICEH